MIAELHRRMMEGETSPVSLTDTYLSVIREKNREWHAFLTVCEEQAREQAHMAQMRYRAGAPRSPLDGIPFALKDNFCTCGIRTTAGSRMLSDYLPPYSASVVERLLGCGGVLLGKTNMDEFGFGSTGENSAFGRTENPRYPGFVPGGSSSGGAAAVAGGMCAYALGSDTGGSVRLPAAFCGIYGLKPTRGAISRYGLIAYSSSMDTVGILADSGEDCRTVFRALRGWDRMDATALAYPTDPPRLCGKPTVGILHDLLADAQTDVAQAVLHAARALEQRGFGIREITLPQRDQMLAAYYTLACAEAASNLARYDGIRFGESGEGYSSEQILLSARSRFGEEVMRRILSGNESLSGAHFREEYLAAVSVSRCLIDALTEVTETCALLLCPVCFRSAWKMGEAARYEDDCCTVVASLSGFPALAMPRSHGAIQLIGAPFSEELLLDAAQILEGRDE